MIYRLLKPYLTGTDTKLDRLLERLLPYVYVFCVYAGTMLSVYADITPDKAVTETMGIIFRIVRLIFGIVGVLLVIVGIFRFILGHSDGNGNQQQSAAIMAAVGAGIIILAALLGTLNLKQFIDTGDFTFK